MSDPKPDSTDLSLLERARTNDPLAWDRLVELYSPVVRRLCGRYNLQTTDVDDIHQLVFVAVWQNLARFRREGSGDFTRWVSTIILNKIRDFSTTGDQNRVHRGVK